MLSNRVFGLIGLVGGYKIQFDGMLPLNTVITAKSSHRTAGNRPKSNNVYEIYILYIVEGMDMAGHW